MLNMQARYTEAAGTLRAMEREGGAAEDTLVQARAWNLLSQVQERQGDFRAELESSRQAGELARAAGAQVELADALGRSSVALVRFGRLQEALALGEEALALSTMLN